MQLDDFFHGLTVVNFLLLAYLFARFRNKQEPSSISASESSEANQGDRVGKTEPPVNSEGYLSEQERQKIEFTYRGISRLNTLEYKIYNGTEWKLDFIDVQVTVTPEGADPFTKEYRLSRAFNFAPLTDTQDDAFSIKFSKELKILDMRGVIIRAKISRF